MHVVAQQQRTGLAKMASITAVARRQAARQPNPRLHVVLFTDDPRDTRRSDQNFCLQTPRLYHYAEVNLERTCRQIADLR